MSISSATGYSYVFLSRRKIASFSSLLLKLMTETNYLVEPITGLTSILNSHMIVASQRLTNYILRLDFFMQILKYGNEIKWVVVIFISLSTNTSAAVEEAIASPPLTPLPEKSGTKVDPTMAIVLVCFLSAFFMICVVSAYFRHYAERQLRLTASTTNGSEAGSMRSVVHGLDPAVIATFSIFSYSSVKGIKIGHTVLECAVCLNEFQDHETLRLLPKCSHVFHSECIDTWLASHVTCPVCRADLMARPGELSHVTESLHHPVDPDIDCTSTEFLLPNESKCSIPITTEMPRSHSTGNSMVVRPIENVERYTLRLPTDKRDLFVNSITTLPTSPHMAFPMESSQKMSFRSVSVGSTRRLDYVCYEGREGGTSRDVSSGSHVPKWWK
ncbi:hypothetical protein L6452_05846 [Arctium lappa]|uniref:Uncharacterized protein n=1 Tax=Arctium lappa TaxID=4217 RepID=A0ACB9EHH6_ARCLA|nr:hypothetical protein L6452_05846 [Arctium lappa]